MGSASAVTDAWHESRAAAAARTTTPEGGAMTGTGTTAVLDRAGLDALVKALPARGRTVLGPTVRDGAAGPHKLGTWYDQFGFSGCVGCGRCIVWCPVGIDITEEVAALHEETRP
jgi:ferredoxin